MTNRLPLSWGPHTRFRQDILISSADNDGDTNDRLSPCRLLSNASMMTLSGSRTLRQLLSTDRGIGEDHDATEGKQTQGDATGLPSEASIPFQGLIGTHMVAVME